MNSNKRYKKRQKKKIQSFPSLAVIVASTSGGIVFFYMQADCNHLYVDGGDGIHQHQHSFKIVGTILC